MKNILLTSCVLAAGLSFFATPVWAQSAFAEPVVQSPALVLASAKAPLDGAKDFILAMTAQGIGFLGNAELSDEDRKAEFTKLLHKNFDMKTLARFSLGSYWRTASDAQKDEYLSLFERMIVEVYSKRFSDYKGQKIEVRGSHAEGSESDFLVNSAILQNNAPEVKVDWRVRYKDGHYKIVDVVVEGVSMALTQRSDFSSVIQRGGGDIEILLSSLRQ